MAWNSVARSPTASRAPRPKRRGGAPVLLLLLLAPAVSGCQTMERMDFWDRFFEASPRPTTAPVVAMEPAQSPGDPAPPAANWNPRPTSVVAMEPIQNPGDRWSSSATDRPPQQAAARAAEPRPDSGGSTASDEEARTRALVRQNPWLTRFWMELTPAQRARVERRLNHGGDVRLAAERPPEPEAVWDLMGLSDRANLVFGKGAPPGRPAPAGDRSGTSASAGDS